jgi:hypothetical protein
MQALPSGALLRSVPATPAVELQVVDGLTYRKMTDGGLAAFVVIHRKSGDVKEEEFHFTHEQSTAERAK